MAVWQACPICKLKQKLTNKKCRCGEDLDKAKRSRRIEYWIYYRVGRKQKVEHVGKSLTDARTAEGKRKTQKREGKIFDLMPGAKITFQELAEWYLGLKSVKKLSSHDRVQLCLKNFNVVFGKKRAMSLRQTDLEGYQDTREERGRAAATIDMEIKYVKAMVTKAFDNDKLDGSALKPFRNVEKKLKKGDNRRTTLVTMQQFQALLENTPYHYRAVLIIAMSTGMRLGEIKGLRRRHIDRLARMIRLPAEVVKERKAKNIPINQNAWAVIDAFPRAVNHDYVIHYEGLPMNGKSSLKKNFGDTCKKAGITYGQKNPKGIVFKDIRRTVKTNMVEAGVDKVYRDSILGHSLKGMDVHYIVPTDAALTAAMEKYTAWLNAQAEMFSANAI